MSKTPCLREGTVSRQMKKIAAKIEEMRNCCKTSENKQLNWDPKRDKRRLGAEPTPNPKNYLQVPQMLCKMSCWILDTGCSFENRESRK